MSLTADERTELAGLMVTQEAVRLRLEELDDLGVDDIDQCIDNFWVYAPKYIKTVYTDPITEKRRFKAYPGPDDPEYEFLYEYDLACRKSGLLVVPKSREMLATTHPLIIAMHECFRVWRRGGIDRTAIVRQNKNHAVELIDRVRASWEMLPKSKQPPLKRDNRDHLEFEGGGEIVALPEEGQTGRGEDWDRVILDEGAHQDHLAGNIQAFGPRTRTLIVPSTFNGDGNAFARLVDGDDYPKRRVLVLGFDRHPMRRLGTPQGDAYHELKKSKMSGTDYQIEIMMRRDVYRVAGYYGSDYTPAVVQSVDWDGHSVVTIGMDYSYLHPAAVVAYENDFEQWCRIREYLLSEMTLERFLPIVFRECKSLYEGARFRVAPDPFRGRQRKGDASDFGNAATDLATTREFAERILGEDTLVSIAITGKLLRKEGHRRVRRGFRQRPIPRPDGEFGHDMAYGTIIDPRCKYLIQGFAGAYGPREDATPSMLDLEEADDRRVHVHVMDADRYGYTEFVETDLGVEYISTKHEPDYDRAARARERAMMQRAEMGLV